MFQRYETKCFSVKSDSELEINVQMLSRGNERGWTLVGIFDFSVRFDTLLQVIDLLVTMTSPSTDCASSFRFDFESDGYVFF